METAIVLNNQIRLVRPHTILKMSIIVPRRNLQKMIDKTGCRLLSKKPVEVGYNHHAGYLYEVEIYVRFESIKPYMIARGVVAEGVGVFRDCHTVSKDSWNAYRLLQGGCNSLLGDSVGLYAFGDCGRLHYPKSTTYINKYGGRKEVGHNRSNDFGEKRYIKRGNKWYSNKKY